MWIGLGSTLLSANKSQPKGLTLALRSQHCLLVIYNSVTKVKQMTFFQPESQTLVTIYCNSNIYMLFSLPFLRHAVFNEGAALRLFMAYDCKTFGVARYHCSRLCNSLSVNW